MARHSTFVLLLLLGRASATALVFPAAAVPPSLASSSECLGQTQATVLAGVRPVLTLPFLDSWLKLRPALHFTEVCPLPGACSPRT